MSEAQTWGVIGKGTIGSEAMRQIAQPRVAATTKLQPTPSLIVGRGGAVFERDATGVLVPNGQTWEDTKNDGAIPQLLLVAMGSGGDGTEAHDYISSALKQDPHNSVITAEKAGLANFFGELRQLSGNFARLGYNATVGGGTGVIDILRYRCVDPANVQEIHLAVNGTLSFIYSSIAPQNGTGVSLGQAVHEAKQLGYAEPEAETNTEVIRGEAEGDVPKKVAILFNSLGLSKSLLDYRDLQFSLSDDDIKRTIQEAKIRRMIVSILPEGSDADHDDIIGRFEHRHDGWKIVMGFPHTDRNPLYAHLARLTGVGNGFVIGEGPDNTDGTPVYTGPGAGPRPTVNTMLNDRLRMLARSRD